MGRIYSHIFAAWLAAQVPGSSASKGERYTFFIFYFYQCLFYQCFYYGDIVFLFLFRCVCPFAGVSVTAPLSFLYSFTFILFLCLFHKHQDIALLHSLGASEIAYILSGQMKPPGALPTCFCIPWFRVGTDTRGGRTGVKPAGGPRTGSLVQRVSMIRSREGQRIGSSRARQTGLDCRSEPWMHTR